MKIANETKKSFRFGFRLEQSLHRKFKAKLASEGLKITDFFRQKVLEYLN